jgi:hypothetical protein
MAQGIASYVRFHSGGTVHAFWQNFYVGQTSHGAAFKSFDAGTAVVTRTADEASSSLRFAAEPSMIAFVEAALQGQYLVDLELYTVDGGGRTLVSAFLGEVVGANTDAVAITIELGLALDALTAQIPGRRMTTALIGNVPKL